MKRVFFVLSIAAACYACGGSDSADKKPVSNNDSNANSSIGGAEIAGAASSAASPATAETTPAATPGKDGKALIEGSDCRICHKDDSKLIGPSYIEVAKKYENTDKNVQGLAEKILKGGQGVWGEIQMPAHPTLTKEDTEAMVKYILSMKK